MVYGDTPLYASLRNLSEEVPCVGDRGDKTLGVICYSIYIMLERASRHVNILDSSNSYNFEAERDPGDYLVSHRRKVKT